MVRTIGILIYPDFQILDASGPVAAFELAGRFAGSNAVLQMLSVTGGLVRSSSGVAIDSAAIDSPTVQRAGALDTLIVVGGEGKGQAMQCPQLRQFLNVQAQSVRRICSICSGAFVLAAAGLLDGRKAATHWRQAEEFAELFPQVLLNKDAIFVHDGKLWTSAGISAGIDLALALIAEDLGEASARRVAREMVVYYRRPAGQSQFSVLQELASDEPRFAQLLGWVRANLHEQLTNETLADRAGMGVRQFARAFTRSTGTSPAKAVERLRLEAARISVEQSDEPIERIAERIGFHDPERMRRAFVRSFGQPPQAMRRLAKREQR